MTDPSRHRLRPNNAGGDPVWAPGPPTRGTKQPTTGGRRFLCAMLLPTYVLVNWHADPVRLAKFLGAKAQRTKFERGEFDE